MNEVLSDFALTTFIRPCLDFILDSFIVVGVLRNWKYLNFPKVHSSSAKS